MNDTVNTVNPLGVENIGKLLRKFAIPSIVAMLVSSLYNIVDQFFIGRSVGTLGNAATNVAFPVSTICVALGLLCGIGGAAAFNIEMGKGNKEKAPFFIGNAVTSMIVVGTILAIIMLVFLTPLLIFFGSPDNVLGYAKDYVGITAIGIPFLIVGTGGGHIIRADGSPNFSMTCNLVGAIINIVLDYLFVMVFDWQMKGAATATIIGQFISFLLVINYLRRYKTVKLEKRHFIPSAKCIGRMTSLGATPFSNQIAIMIVQITLNKSLTYYGALSHYGDSIPLACAGIIMKVNQIYFAIVIGLSQSIQPIASFNMGAKKYKRVKKTYSMAITCGTIVSIIAFIMFQVFPRNIISLFGDGTPEYYQFAINYFRIFLFMTFVNAVQPISSTFCTAIGKPKKGMILALTRQIIFLLPLIVILPLKFGIDGIMYAAPIADGAAFLVSLLVITNIFKNMKE